MEGNLLSGAAKEKDLFSFSDIITQDPQMLKILETIQLIKDSLDSSLLIIIMSFQFFPVNIVAAK